MSRRNLALVLLYASVVLFLQFRPNHDVDLFCQARTGKLVLERGELVRNDPFTATHCGDAVPTIGWLSQVGYALLHTTGGWRLLHQINAMVFAGALLIAAFSVRPGDTTIRANLLGMILGVLVALPHCEIRPHSFGILGFATLLWLAQSQMGAWRKLIAAVGVLVVWQNMHPSVPLGAVTIGAWAAVGWWRFLLDRKTPKPWFLSLLALTAAACCLATPMGTGVFARSAYNTRISQELGITEWLPLWDPTVWSLGGWTVWAAIGASLLLMLRVRRHLRLEDVATLLLLSAGALMYFRLSLFFAVAMVPVWSRWIALAWTSSEKTPAEAEAGLSPWLAGGLITLALLVALGLPRLLHTDVFDREIPLTAASRMKELGVHGVIYNYREWSGPLIWEGFPDWKVTIDGRLYIYPREEWQRYADIAKGRVSVEQVEQWYQPDAFFLRPSFHKRFIEQLRESDRWREVYEDDTAVIFIRSQ